MDEEYGLSKCAGYVDWRNRIAIKGRHGGILAAFFVLVVEALENLAYLANASNLVLYLTKYMHFSPSKSAIIVTNFMGTAFLLALLGGFLSDAYFTTYHVFLVSALIQFMGLLILAMQAHIPSLQPPPCQTPITAAIGCSEVTGGKAAVLFIGLYLVALGVGGIKGSLPPHGAEQFDDKTKQGRKKRSTFFNYYVFCLSCGGLIAVTFVVWIEDNIGWQWGFGVSTLSILLAIPVFMLGSPIYRIKVPTGSPLTVIFKVLTAAICNKVLSKKQNNAIGANNETNPQIDDASTNIPSNPSETTELKFLNQALTDNPIHQTFECSTKQVEEVKIVLKTIPIFASTIMLNCCLAQLSTFSVQQASTMNTKLRSFKIPPASLPVFPIIFIMILAPLYNHIILAIARKLTKTEMGITYLQRIGMGLVMSIIAMAVASIVETKRKNVAIKLQLLDSSEPLPITFLWIALQYLCLGSADLFSLAGLLEFFYTETPKSMKSLATSFSWASLAIGYFLSSTLVAVVNRVTGIGGQSPWLKGSNLNYYRLERFYWLMCVLSGLNFLNYLFWASRYKYRSMI